MKRTKTNFRARLTSENLSDRLAVSLLGESIKNYNPRGAAIFWMKSANSRTQERKQSTSNSEESDQDIEENLPASIDIEEADIELNKAEADKFLQGFKKRKTNHLLSQINM